MAIVAAAPPSLAQTGPTVQKDEWIQWASHNLAAGVSEGKVVEEMAAGGIEPAGARAIVAEIRRSPIHAAAVRLGAEVRKWSSLADALLTMEAEWTDFSRVPRRSDLSSEEFLRDYYAANRPVIIEDVACKWPALAKWNLDFFRERFGSEEVTYQRGRSDDDHRDSFIDHSVTGPFSDYLDLVGSDRPTNDFYLIAHDRLLDRPGFQPLFEDILFDPRYFDPVNREGRVFFWLGPAGSTTPMHRDLGNVYFAQISGRKTVKLIPSKQMHKVYNEFGYHSEVDFENLSLDAYPLLRKVHIMEEVINPGELLFIPLGWWHHVRALDRSITITGNNFRFNNAFAAIF